MMRQRTEEDSASSSALSIDDRSLSYDLTDSTFVSADFSISKMGSVNKHTLTEVMMRFGLAVSHPRIHSQCRVYVGMAGMMHCRSTVLHRMLHDDCRSK